MTLFSERNGEKRTYSANDLYDAIRSELETWEVKQLLYYQFGGEIYFDDKNESGGTREYHLVGELTNPAAYFRRNLKKNLAFSFRNADSLIRSLPVELNPRNGGDINLLFDFLELIYGQLKHLTYNQSTQKLGVSKKKAQEIFRNAMNPDLALYRQSYKMLANGQIIESSHKPVTTAVEQALSLTPGKGVSEQTLIPLQKAAISYLAHGSNLDQKKQAIRDLADSLESIRGKVKENLLADDEKDLFMVANKFAVRHNDNKQKAGYDKKIWYDWMFYVNLAALLTVIRIIQSQASKD